MLSAVTTTADKPAADPWADPAAGGAVDASRKFLADSLCPLRHSPVWESLDDDQRLRYNQLCGLFQNEMIVLFETTLAESTLPAVLADRSLPADLRDAAEGFLEDERRHTAAFLALNRASEPTWYMDEKSFHVLRLPRGAASAGRAVGARPGAFPFVFWLMLVMEERSLMISRRIAAEDRAGGGDHVCPRWAAVYRAHLLDEVHHVRADRLLLDRYWRGRPALLRRANAALLRAALVGLFLKPRRANVRVVDLLVADFPALAPRRDALAGAARSLDGCDGYRRMMYSAESAPITRRLFAELPELAPLWGRIAG